MSEATELSRAGTRVVEEIFVPIASAIEGGSPTTLQLPTRRKISEVIAPVRKA